MYQNEFGYFLYLWKIHLEYVRTTLNGYNLINKKDCVKSLKFWRSIQDVFFIDIKNTQVLSDTIHKIKKRKEIRILSMLIWFLFCKC